MTRATEFVNHMYSLHRGRAAVTVGVDTDFNTIHPFVFENKHRVPTGLIGMAASHESVPTEVDIYHLSAFITGKGQGSEIMRFLCRSADDFGVCLCIQASVQQNGRQAMTGEVLVNWYRKFGFSGKVHMRREPAACM